MEAITAIKENLQKRLESLQVNDENFDDRQWLIEQAKNHIEDLEILIWKLNQLPERLYNEVKLPTTFKNTDYLLVVYVYENEKYARMQRLLSYETMTSVLYTEKVDALYDHCEEVIKEYIQSNYNQIFKLEL